MNRVSGLNRLGAASTAILLLAPAGAADSRAARAATSAGPAGP